MNPDQIELFFSELNRELDQSAVILLTGAAAGSLLGHIRPSLDIDFEITLKGRRTAEEAKILEDAIRTVQEKTKISAQYSQDIAHWSMIELLDYREKALPYKTIGKLRLKVLAPEHWTIGKMDRYLNLDIDDMIQVIRKKRLKSEDLAAFWGKALRGSPLSLNSRQFRAHVEDFFSTYGKRIWGRSFQKEEAIQTFHRSAKIR